MILKYDDIVQFPFTDRIGAKILRIRTLKMVAVQGMMIRRIFRNYCFSCS